MFQDPGTPVKYNALGEQPIGLGDLQDVLENIQSTPKSEDWSTSDNLGPQMTWSPVEACEPTVVPNQKADHDKLRRTFPKFPDWSRKAAKWLNNLPRRTSAIFRNGQNQETGLEMKKMSKSLDRLMTDPIPAPPICRLPDSISLPLPML